MYREGKKCLLYSRVSTEMQVDGYSLEGQITCMKRFAEREDMQIIKIYEDAGKSGKSIEGRPAFKRMLSDIGSGLEVDYILVYKLSRFGRNAADILSSLDYIQSYNVNLISVDEGIDSSQASGKLLISVLSAVAEIERENILEQTMNGRKEKARQGKWNGGPAPFGYLLKDEQLYIQEDEAEIVRLIFDKFISTKIGYGGIAKYLNLQGIKKTPHHPNAIEAWSGHYIQTILDNPVYVGKIAYGRRVREKKKGTKNVFQVVNASEYIYVDGKHEAIISEEVWNRARDKRVETGKKYSSKIGRDRIHLLTGILRCPKCGGKMYCNRHYWTKKDGTYQDVYYYYCARSNNNRGVPCDYKAKLRKMDIEPLVIEVIKALVQEQIFVEEIRNRMEQQIDTSKIEIELKNYLSKLHEVEQNKARLENEIDSLPLDTKYRERKVHDMTLRLDVLYDTIAELEERIEEAKFRKKSIETEVMTLENIHQILRTFGKLYDIIDEDEKKSLISYLIKEIQIYPNEEKRRIPLKSIEFNFPIYKDGKEVRKILWSENTSVETLVVLKRN